MKDIFRRLSILIVGALFMIQPVSTWAQTYGVQITGLITAYWIDASADAVIEFSVPGACGSAYFRLRRSSVNFDQMNALLLSASLSGKSVTIEHYSECSGTATIISHGAIRL